MELNKKLSQIQAKLKAKKSKFNSFGKYNYRSAEDILEATKPYLLELGVSVVITEVLLYNSNQLFPILESTATLRDETGAIHATAIVGIDLAQKGMQMPQKFGSASSYGKKYSLGNLFLIDDTADSDAINNHDKTSKPKLAGAALTKAKAFLKAGGSLDAIKGKYEIPAELLKTL